MRHFSRIFRVSWERCAREWQRQRTRFARRLLPRSFAPRWTLLAVTAGFTMDSPQFSASDFMRKEKEASREKDQWEDGEWETIHNEADIVVYRRPLHGTDRRNVFEYKCVGTFLDISPVQFLHAQLDLAFRKTWDQHILELAMIERDEVEDVDVIRWVTKYPFPLYAREYIYSRRRFVDHEKREITIISEVVNDKARFPSSGNFHRVNLYSSQMRVKAHSEFHEKGLDYVLTYHDDPEAYIPSSIYNWFVMSGGPEFLRRVHKAALSLDDNA